jgi:Copper amine oxidase N-terminal domain
MKQVLKLVVLGLCFITIATTQQTYPKVYLDNILMPANTSESIFAATLPNAPLAPLQIDGHWLIPVRFIHFILGKDIWWDPQWEILEIDRQFHFQLNNLEVHFPVATVGGTTTGGQTLEIAPQIIDDRLYVPLETVLQLMHYTYTWTADEQRLDIQTPEQ